MGRGGLGFVSLGARIPSSGEARQPVGVWWGHGAGQGHRTRRASAANWKRGGRQLWRGQNCGSYFGRGYRNGCLSWGIHSSSCWTWRNPVLTQCPGAVYLPQEGCILRGTFQAGSVPKIRAGINCSRGKVLLNVRASFQPVASCLVFLIDRYSKKLKTQGVEDCSLLRCPCQIFSHLRLSSQRPVSHLTLF